MHPVRNNQLFQVHYRIASLTVKQQLITPRSDSGVSAQETLRRAHRRDLEPFGTAGEIERRYLRRYLPGQVLYRRTSDPEALAHILVDNQRTDSPRIERWSLPGIDGRP